MKKNVTRKDIEKKLRETLLSLREEKSKQSKTPVTQEEVSKQTGIARTSILTYERGAGIPDSEKLYKLADYYGVSCDYLLGREDGTTHDTTYMMKELGLSEKSIEVLRNAKKDDAVYILFALDQILNNKYGLDFLKAFSKYVAVPEFDPSLIADDIFRSLYIQELSLFVASNSYYNRNDLHTMSYIPYDDIHLLQLQNTLNDMLTIIKTDEKTKEEYITKFKEEHEMERLDILNSFVPLEE